MLTSIFIQLKIIPIDAFPSILTFVHSYLCADTVKSYSIIFVIGYQTQKLVGDNMQFTDWNF